MSFYKIRPRVYALSAVLCVFLGVSGASAATVPEGYVKRNYANSAGVDHLWHWERFPVRVFVATHDSEEEQASRAALAGFDDWVAATGNVVRYTVVNSPAQADVTVRFTAAAFLPGQPSVAGETQVLASRRGVLRKASMVLATGEATPEEVQSVAAHEFGHALGIGGHSDNADDMMYPVETRMVFLDGSSRMVSAHRITRRDLNTVHLCYPRLAFPAG